MTNKFSTNYPVTEKDFHEVFALVEENLFKNDLALEEFKKASVGDILIVRNSDRVIGMLHMYRPGKVFEEIEEKYFDPKNISGDKSKIGYIALVSVEKNAQGKGIGKLLVEKALESTREWGAEKVIVHVSKSSPGNASEKLFASFGFVPTKLHKAPWQEYSLRRGPKGFWCNFCGNPCHCDELEMLKDLI